MIKMHNIYPWGGGDLGFFVGGDMNGKSAWIYQRQCLLQHHGDNGSHGLGVLE